MRREIAGAVGFLPTMLGGCVLWLRADLGITIATGVANWADQSGAGNSCGQGVAGQQPARNTADSAYGGQATVSFSGASSTALNNATLHLSTPYTVVLVGENDAAAAGGFFGDPTDGAGVVYSTAGQLIQFFNGSAVAGTANISSPSAIAVVFNGASSAAYVNNSQTANVNGNPGSASFASGYQLGSSGAPANLTGKIAEVAVFTAALSSASLARLFHYFSLRYRMAGVS